MELASSAGSKGVIRAQWKIQRLANLRILGRSGQDDANLAFTSTLRSRSLMFDFDRIIERRGTHSSKWDHIARLSGIESPDAIAMWVADMDFAAPPGMTSALTAEIQCAVHGYYADTGSWAAALTDWM